MSVIKEIPKPWGKEEILSINDKYVLKKLFMNKGHSCSLQYHEIKHETIYVLSGILKIVFGDSKDSLEEKKLHEGDTIIIPTGKIHRMEAEEDSIYLEVSTPELEDVVRLEDKYNRI